MIGAALTRYALEKGDEVLAVIRPFSAKQGNIPKSKRLVICESDLSDYSSLALPGEYDIFFHCAWDKTVGEARNDAFRQHCNIGYTLEAVALARRLECSVFVGAGSQAEYGQVAVPLTPEMAVNPQSGYGIAKYAAGKLSAIACKEYHMRHNWARILSVYGEGDQPNSLIMYCISQLLDGKSPELTPCDQVWDYIYVEDAAEALYLIGQNGKDQQIYCLGSGEAKPLKAYVQSLGNIVNPSIPLQFGMRSYYPQQAMYLCADITSLTKDTGFTPKVSFEAGIQKTMDWYRKLNHENN
jgi:nucleoside-diphosphate-sugar epimerase